MLRQNDSYLKASITFVIISILLAILLFFRCDKYAMTDLLRAAVKLKTGDFNHLLFAVRPAILIVAYILPITPEDSLPLISIVSYVASIFLTYYFTKSLYDDLSAVLATALLAANFPVILNSSAPNADIAGLAASLLTQCLALRLLRRESIMIWGFYGLLSGFLVLVRETVLMPVIAVCLLLFYKRMRRAFLFYSGAAFSIIMTWQIYTSLMFHMNYLTQFFTGLSLSTKYSGVLYNPLKVIRYLLDGLSPILIVMVIIGFVLEEQKERFKVLHIFGVPSLILSIGWPAIYEPRIAVIALPGLIHVGGYGLRKILESLSDKPVYGAKNGLLSLFLVLLIYLSGNSLLAYINNGYKISPIWRFIELPLIALRLSIYVLSR